MPGAKLPNARRSSAFAARYFNNSCPSPSGIARNRKHFLWRRDALEGVAAERAHRLRDAARELGGEQQRGAEILGERLDARGAVHGRTHHGEVEPLARADVAVD